MLTLNKEGKYKKKKIEYNKNSRVTILKSLLKIR